MKKLFSILFAASAILFVSCAKELGDNKTATDAKLTGETITFSATIDMPALTRAALSSLNIEWQSGDYIGIATDNDATIRVYPVTVDGVDATKCTITVDKVDGASGYYAIFKGRLGNDGGANEVDADDFSMISFNTSTKTFSGLTVGNQQVAANSLSSYLWYTNGYPLAMAGKADGASLSMRPCLALVKLGIDAESVPAGDYYVNDPYVSSYSINHDHYYSAVRGFNLYQIGGSTIYSSGDFTVQIADNGSLTTTATGDQQYRQISQSGILASGTDYLMCLIPGGSITSFKVDFLGYADNTPTLSWDAVYTMRLPAAITVAPGDYYDLGVLNPLGRKKAKNEAEDEAADALAVVPFTPSITIDGSFDDWDPAKNSKIVGKISSSTGGSHYQEFKIAYDDRYVYLYTKRDWSESCNVWATSAYIYYGFDLDNDSDTPASTLGEMPGADATILINPFDGSIDSPALSLSATKLNGSSYSFDGLEFDGTITTVSSRTGYLEFEMRVKRSDIKNGAKTLENGNTINVFTWGNKSASDFKTSATSITIND